jgi:hypothetical protein
MDGGRRELKANVNTCWEYNGKSHQLLSVRTVSFHSHLPHSYPALNATKACVKPDVWHILPCLMRTNSTLRIIYPHHSIISAQIRYGSLALKQRTAHSTASLWNKGLLARQPRSETKDCSLDSLDLKQRTARSTVSIWNKGLLARQPRSETKDCSLDSLDLKQRTAHSTASLLQNDFTEGLQSIYMRSIEINKEPINQRNQPKPNQPTYLPT